MDSAVPILGEGFNRYVSLFHLKERNRNEKYGLWKTFALAVLATGFAAGCTDMGQIFQYKHPKIEARK